MEPRFKDDPKKEKPEIWNPAAWVEVVLCCCTVFQLFVLFLPSACTCLQPLAFKLLLRTRNKYLCALHFSADTTLSSVEAREHTEVSVTKFDFWRTCQHSPLDYDIRVEFAKKKRYNKCGYDNPGGSPVPEDRDKSEENAETSSVKLITPDLVVMIRCWK